MLQLVDIGENVNDMSQRHELIWAHGDNVQIMVPLLITIYGEVALQSL